MGSNLKIASRFVNMWRLLDLECIRVGPTKNGAHREHFRLRGYAHEYSEPYYA